MSTPIFLKQISLTAIAVALSFNCGLSTPAPAQDKMLSQSQPNTSGKVSRGKPTVVFIHSRECPVCARVRPIMKDLQTAYADQITFISLDVTDDKAKSESKALARSLKLGAFFNLYSDVFPCVGIFDRQNQTVRELCGFQNKEKYESYIRQALERSQPQKS